MPGAWTKLFWLYFFDFKQVFAHQAHDIFSLYCRLNTQSNNHTCTYNKITQNYGVDFQQIRAISQILKLKVKIETFKKLHNSMRKQCISTQNLSFQDQFCFSFPWLSIFCDYWLLQIKLLKLNFFSLVKNTNQIKMKSLFLSNNYCF